MSLREDGGMEGTEPRKESRYCVWECRHAFHITVENSDSCVIFLLLWNYSTLYPEGFYLSTYYGGKVRSTFQKSVLNQKRIGNFLIPNVQLFQTKLHSSDVKYHGGGEGRKEWRPVWIWSHTRKHLIAIHPRFCYFIGNELAATQVTMLTTGLRETSTISPPLLWGKE